MSAPVAITSFSFVDARLFQPGLQEILEEFLAEKVQPVAALAAQHRVQKARGEHAI